jgi:hypothetical protein
VKIEPTTIYFIKEHEPLKSAVMPLGGNVNIARRMTTLKIFLSVKIRGEFVTEAVTPNQKKDGGKQMETESSKFDIRPYIQKIEEIPNYPEQISVYLVDGTWVRKYLQREFSNFAHHYSKPKGIGGDAFKCIPEHEFWIDNGADPAEIPFFIDHLRVEHYLMRRGMSYELAEKEGTKVEERERHRNLPPFATHSPKKMKAEGVNPELREIQEALITAKKMPANVQIFLVEGKLVRDKIDPRFCAGGHSEVYGYIPENHIWIDNGSMLREWPFYIIHELHEFRDMVGGMRYPEAHKIASRIEWKSRWDPNFKKNVWQELGLR